VPTTLSAADTFVTQQPDSPAAPGAQFQFTRGDTWNIVSRLLVVVDADKTGLFDLAFHAVAKANRSSDGIVGRYLIDGKPDPNDMPTGNTLGSDAVNFVQYATANGIDNFVDLSYTRQIKLSPGVHTVLVEINSFGSDPNLNGNDVTIFSPVLQLTGYNRIDGHPSADGYQTQEPFNSVSPGVGYQDISAGSWQTVSVLSVNVDSAKTGQFDMGFRMTVSPNLPSDEVSVRYLIDGQPDPGDPAQSQFGADIVEDVRQYTSLSLTRQFSLSPGPHVVSVQVMSRAPSQPNGIPNLRIFSPLLHLTGYNTVNGVVAAVGTKVNTPAGPVSPGSGVEVLSAKTWTTVSSLAVNVGDIKTGDYSLAFHAVAQPNANDEDQIYVRYLIDGHLDPNDPGAAQLGADVIRDVLPNTFGNKVNLSLTRSLHLAPGLHSIEVQVQGTTVAVGKNHQDLFVYDPVLQLTGYNNVTIADYVTSLIGMNSAGTWWATPTSGLGPQGIGRSVPIVQWNPAAGWHDAVTGDFNGDGLIDVAAMTSWGDWYVALDSLSTYKTSLFTTWNPAAGWNNVQVADFNGDGKADIMGRTSWGDWWVGLSDGTKFTTTFWGNWNPAANWSNFEVADFNGDGKADVAGMTSWGAWYVGLSTGTTFNTNLWATWNPAAGWHDPLVGDFNGDGKADIAAFTWWGDLWIGTSDGSAFSARFLNRFDPSAGWTDFRAGDFDGDGVTDVAARDAKGDLGVFTIGEASPSLRIWTVWDPSRGWNHVVAADLGVPIASPANPATAEGLVAIDLAARTSDGYWMLTLSNGQRFSNQVVSYWSPALSWSAASAGRVSIGVFIT
jgi:hypothetical protein